MAQVPFERVVHADETPSDWLTYSGNYAGQRFSRLSQLNRSNVNQLKLGWVYQAKSTSSFETTPIIADGTMYITETYGVVKALDARSGRLLWSYQPSKPKGEDLSVNPVNRGVALLDNTVYVGTAKTHLVALDAKSGAVRWETVVHPGTGYAMTSAPLAIDHRIIVGVAGGDNGERGFVDAYDPQTGKRLWRTYTIPAAGEPGVETWANKSYETGGGPTWVTGSYDPVLHLLYWGVGNPAPIWNGTQRAGDNLYTNSLLALDPKDGKVKWYFQFTPHDTHDWDSNHIPVLFDEMINGKMRKIVAVANRNGFYYVLDRETGEFLSGTPFVRQNWADGLDAKGRPIFRPGSEPTKEGSLIYPGVGGAANWWSPSYSPQTKLFYLAAGERGTKFFLGDLKYQRGEAYLGGGVRHDDADKSYGAIRALESTTGKLKWEFKLFSPPLSGVLSTAGGLVFGGTQEGNFFALDAENGKPLWDVTLGEEMKTNPISFAVDGKQYVAATAGHALFVFKLP